MFFIAMSGQENNLAQSEKTRKSRVFYRPRFSLKTLLVFVAMCAAIFAAFPHVRAWWARQVSLDLAFDVSDVDGWWEVTYTGPYEPNLRELAWLTRVRKFRIQRRLDGDDLQYISQWTDLRELNIGGTAIEDVHVRHLAELRDLRVLYLGGTKISGPGMKHLSGLKSLTYLDLSRTPIGRPDDVEHIGLLTSLKSLRLDSTRINNECIERLTNLIDLEYIDLSHTNIDDSAVDSLQKMPALKRCRLLRTNVSAEARERLEAAGIDTFLDLPGPMP
jgi:hypothetical protein